MILGIVNLKTSVETNMLNMFVKRKNVTRIATPGIQYHVNIRTGANFM